MEGQEQVATHTRPEERPDWQQPKQEKPVHRVKAISRPHPWPQSKCQSDDFLTKRFTEVQ